MNFHQKPVTYVGHVKIKVQNLARSIAFYQDIIGFKVLEQTETSAKLTTDGKTSILSLEQPDDVTPKQGRTTGLYHFAILLPKRSDLANIVKHFAENRVPLGSSDHLVSEALYLNDPDGNGIEVYRDRDPSEWHWHDGQVEMTVDPLNFPSLMASAEPEATWNGLPENTLMGHIHLHVADLQKAEHFYVDGLGFEVVTRYGGQAIFISSGKYHHHIGLNVWNGIGAPQPPASSVGLAHYTLVLADEETRRKTVESLKQIGATVKEEQDKVVTYDPSGNEIHLHV